VILTEGADAVRSDGQTDKTSLQDESSAILTFLVPFSSKNGKCETQDVNGYSLPIRRSVIQRNLIVSSVRFTNLKFLQMLVSTASL
jgi:hypothetical protein